MSDVRFEFRCSACALLVDDGTGHVQVSKADMRRAEESREQYEAKAAAAPAGIVSASDLLALYSAPWSALHLACDPNEDSEFYAVEVEKIRTPLQALDWAAHLGEKGWIGDTTWSEFLSSLVTQGKAQPA